MPLIDGETPTVTTARKEPRKAKARKMTAPKSFAEMSLGEKLNSPAAEAARNYIAKKFGADAIGGFAHPMPEIRVIPTGFHALDAQIAKMNPARGGIPRGMVSEISGEESSGKTTFCLGFIANAQRTFDAHAVFIDVEKSLDSEYARKIGVNLGTWDYFIAHDGDEAAEMARTWASVADIIVIDSFGVMNSKQNIDKPMDETQIRADSVNLINRLLMKTASPIWKRGCALVAINQVRAKMNAQAWEDPTDTPGGKRLRHAYGLRLKAYKGRKILQGDEMIGMMTKIKVIKSKIGPQFGAADLPIIFGEGISIAVAVFEEALRMGVIEQSGSFYGFAGERLGQGKEACRTLLRENKELLDKIQDAIQSKDATLETENLTAEVDPTEFAVNGDVDVE
jgi:recombination protein RecA